jgi:hypothetical protein
MVGEIKVDGAFIEAILKLVLGKFEPATPVTMTFRKAKEVGAVAFGSDQLVKLLDLVAELDRKRVGLEFASISDSLQSSSPGNLLAYRSASRPATPRTCGCNACPAGSYICR